MTKVTRNYVHRDHGKIGHVELEAPNGKWKLDGEELPASSIDHLLTFALQTLQDAYAGADSADDAKGRWSKKRDALIAGTVGVRTGGVDPVVAETRRLVRNAVKAKEGAEKVKAMTDDELDAIVAKNGDTFTNAAKASLELKRKQREDAAKLAASVGDITI